MLLEKGKIDEAAVREVLDRAKREGRTALGPADARKVAEAYGIPVPEEGFATSAEEAVRLAEAMGFPVVLKIVSPDILHKTEAGGVITGVTNAAAVRDAYAQIVASAHRYKPTAKIDGVQIQQQLVGRQEVIIGAVTDPSFGKLIAFGLGGVLVEFLKDVTFRLAPASREDALSMLDSIQAADVLKGVRGGEGVDREALAAILVAVSQLVTDFPEIAEVDLNPVFAGKDGAVAVDLRVLLDFQPQPQRQRPSQDEILLAMNRIMRPKAVAVIGASNEDGKIGNSVMKNLIGGGYKGKIFPIHPKSDAIPAQFVAGALVECGEKKIPGAVLIPSGFAETGNVEGQREIVEIGRKYNIRLMGPNIYGFYYTPEHLCATFCTAYDVQGKVALSSQSGGVGMAIVGFSRSAKMGVSAIVGLGNKADLDEDDLLTFFEQDDNTQAIAMHFEDLKDGRSFVEVAKRTSRKKPVIALKAGRTALGARAAASHTAALAGNDKVYDDLL